MPEDDWNNWIGGIRRCDPDVVQAFWNDYGCRLVRLADANLQETLRRRVDADDIAQSAIRTFLRRIGEGQFDVSDDQKLWSLLCAITLNKVRMAARFHLREKRGLHRETSLNEATDAKAAMPDPTVDDAQCLIELVRDELESISDEQERLAFQLKLQEYDNHDISERIGCSERTVRRLLKRVRERLEKRLA